MSSDFTVGGYWCSCTNGTAEAYLKKLRELTDAKDGIDQVLIDWLADFDQQFYPDMLIDLNEILVSPSLANQFAELFDRATESFLKGSDFTENGKQWLTVVAPELREHILTLYPPSGASA